MHTLLPSANDLTGSLQAGDTASKRLSSGGVLATAASSCSRRNRLGSLCFACLEAVDAHDAQRGQLLRSTDRLRLGLPLLHSHVVLNACDAAGTCRTSGRRPQHAQHVSSHAAHMPRPARLAAATAASRALQSAAAYPGAGLPRTDEGLPARPHPAALMHLALPRTHAAQAPQGGSMQHMLPRAHAERSGRLSALGQAERSGRLSARACRWPILRREFFRRRFLNTVTLASWNCSCAAPRTRGRQRRAPGKAPLRAKLRSPFAPDTAAPAPGPRQCPPLLFL